MQIKHILFFIPLTFLIVSFFVIPQTFGATASGKPAWETNSAKVCGDRLCSEISSEDGTLQVRGGFVSEKIDSPKKQMARGVEPSEILCKEGRVLIIKHNGSPACVKSSTAIKLEEQAYRGILCY